MIELTVLTHQGLVVKEEVELVQVISSEYNFGILQNHIPLVTVIEDGYIKYTIGKEDRFVAVCAGIFEFSNNKANVLAQEAQYGPSIEEANSKIEALRKIIIENNRKNILDFTKKERELHEHIKNANAGKI